MKALCSDGTVIDCDDFKAVDSGVVLIDDRLDSALGFVPADRIEYVLPDAVAAEMGYVPGAERAGEPPGSQGEMAGEGIGTTAGEGGGEPGEPVAETDWGTAEMAGEMGGDEGATTETGWGEGPTTGVVEQATAGTRARRPTRATQSVELGLLREQVEAMQARLELVERRMEHEAAEAGTSSGVVGESVAVEAEGTPLAGEISGLGSTYAGRLADAGIETVEDLAAADPDTVAEAAEAPRQRAEDWVEQAKGR